MKTSPFIILFISLFLWNCNGQQAKIKKLEPKEFTKEISLNTNSQIIDVRTPEEFSGEHINNARNINWNNPDFQSEVSKLDKNKPVFVYCLSGGRSAKAASKLASMGFENIYDMNGGMVKYISEGLSENTEENQGMSKDDYLKTIASAEKILVSFNAKWCAPCKKMAPYLSKMEKEFTSKTKLLKIDADQNKILLKHLNVTEIPTMYLYKKGKIVWQHIGFIDESELRKELSKV